MNAAAQTPFQYFHERCDVSWSPERSQTRENERRVHAIDLAAAERLATERGCTFQWFAQLVGPLADKGCPWTCVLFDADDEEVESQQGIRANADRRLIQAELALSHLREIGIVPREEA